MKRSPHSNQTPARTPFPQTRIDKNDPQADASLHPTLQLSARSASTTLQTQRSLSQHRLPNNETLNSEQSRWHLISRTGQRPLRFKGRALTRIETPAFDKHRSYAVEIFETTGGLYVAAVYYTSSWRGEIDATYTFFGTGEEIAEALEGYYPLGPVRGYPPGPKYATRQERLMEDINRAFASTVESVLTFLPESTYEMVE